MNYQIRNAKKEDLPPLAENTYYIRDLIGLSVYDGDTLLGGGIIC